MRGKKSVYEECIWLAQKYSIKEAGRVLKISGSGLKNTSSNSGFISFQLCDLAKFSLVLSCVNGMIILYNVYCCCKNV